jgi:cytochrome c oxidase subunit 3
MGGINTVILLCSSLTMAWGVRAAQLGQRKLLVLLLSLTLLGGFGFMGIKYVEYKAKWEHGLLWARSFTYQSHAEEPAEEHGEEPTEELESVPEQAPEGFAPERTTIPPPATAPAGRARDPVEVEPHAEHSDAPKNAQTFFTIYFMMTGLHGLHVIIGMLAIGWVLRKALRGTFGPGYFTPVDLVGLYWHLVDLIWIFLFPLLYLIR